VSPEVLAELKRRALVAAINTACNRRGDSEENRLALIRECIELTIPQQEDLTGHFQEVARCWTAAARNFPK
jgi:hypothetical protein